MNAGERMLQYGAMATSTGPSEEKVKKGRQEHGMAWHGIASAPYPDCAACCSGVVLGALVANGGAKSKSTADEWMTIHYCCIVRSTVRRRDELNSEAQLDFKASLFQTKAGLFFCAAAVHMRPACHWQADDLSSGIIRFASDVVGAWSSASPPMNEADYVPAGSRLKWKSMGGDVICHGGMTDESHCNADYCNDAVLQRMDAMQ
ncbi:hypothetical protein J3F84DRAFT_15601 [Trichoderma pleuroticola]